MVQRRTRERKKGAAVSGKKRKMDNGKKGLRLGGNTTVCAGGSRMKPAPPGGHHVRVKLSTLDAREVEKRQFGTVRPVMGKT